MITSQLTILIIFVSIAYGMTYSDDEMPRYFYAWKRLEFGFPSKLDREEAEATGNLIPTNAIPIDVQPFYDDRYNLRVFVTIPKFLKGIPYTLAEVSYEKGSDGPVLQPYPNYPMNQNENGNNCDAITSAFGMVINECNQMWVIDAGVVGSKMQCPPQLLLIDLDTNEVIHRYRFDDSLYINGASMFVTPAISVRDPSPTGYCRNTMVYIADVNSHGLVVYDYQKNTAWRIENMFMYPDPNHGLLTVGHKSFVLMGGLFSLVADNNYLYFHPLASKSEFAVPLRVIDNRTLFDNDVGNMYQSFIKLGERNSTCTASTIDCNNNVYCVTLEPIELIKWNVQTPYDKWHIQKLPTNPDEMQFVSGIKVVENEQELEELWMISNKFQDMATGSQNFSEINFRILMREL